MGTGRPKSVLGQAWGPQNSPLARRAPNLILIQPWHGEPQIHPRHRDPKIHPWHRDPKPTLSTGTPKPIPGTGTPNPPSARGTQNPSLAQGPQTHPQHRDPKIHPRYRDPAPSPAPGCRARPRCQACPQPVPGGLAGAQQGQAAFVRGEVLEGAQRGQAKANRARARCQLARAPRDGQPGRAPPSVWVPQRG